jgi:CRISPR-associated protein Cas1
MILEISEHGSTLKRNHDCFLVQTPSDKIEIPAEKVEAIMITANALVSTQAVALCLEKGIQLVLANWSGKPFGRFWMSTPGRATEVRRKQYLHQESPLAFKLSKEIVSQKLREQKKLLTDLKNNRKTPSEKVQKAIENINRSLVNLKSLEYTLSFKQSLLGIEGFAASEYFSAISEILPKKYAFRTRSRQPAEDKFNAVLNYAYGLTYSNVEKVVILSGLDPNAGIYHADAYGKPTLVFDVIELFRAKVDRLAIKLFTKRMVRDSWFMVPQQGEPEPGVFLSKEGRKAVIDEYVKDVSTTIERESWGYCRKMITNLIEEG